MRGHKQAWTMGLVGFMITSAYHLPPILDAQHAQAERLAAHQERIEMWQAEAN